jgi:hypothetical protein
VLAGQPRNFQGWRAAHKQAFAALQVAAEGLGFTKQEVGGGRRGSFPTIAHGLSFGGGQEVRSIVPVLCLLLRDEWFGLATTNSPPQVRAREGHKTVGE